MAVPEDTGYPLKWFNNQETVRDSYECLVCLEVLKDPVQVRDCGHQFCKYCLDSVMKSGQLKCPSCRKEISNEMIFSDIAAMRVIGKLDVNCPNNECEWDGCLNSLLQEHTEVCLFLELPCSNVGCNEQVIRGEMPAHFTMCEYRTVVCEYCLKNYVFRDKFEHLEGCPSLPVPCTNKCVRKSIARNKMEEHLKTECIKTVVKCNYSEIGCNYKCQRQKLQGHLKQKIEDHLRLSSLEISRLKDKCGRYEEDMEELRQKCERYEEGMEELRQKCGRREEDMEELRQKCECHEEDMEELRQKCDQYEEHIEELKQKADTVLYLMIIPDFNKKLLEARDNNSFGMIKSDPFYTSPYGYKMRLRVCLNETRKNYKKDHMGVYLNIVKSDHDEIFSWPFKKKYTFTLIDQQDDEEKRKNIVRSSTPNGEDNFKKPQRNESEGLGFANFVSHETLRTRSYVKDDIVMIKFSIDI